jgi:hypothetical protein
MTEVDLMIRQHLDRVTVPECKAQAVCVNGRHCIDAGCCLRSGEVAVVPATQLAGAVEALRPFVEKYDAVGREFCPDFDGPLDLAAFDAAARVLGGQYEAGGRSAEGDRMEILGRWRLIESEPGGVLIVYGDPQDPPRAATELEGALHRQLEGAVALDDELLANLDQRAARQKTDRAGYLRWVLTGKAPITVGGQ